jgi:biopolymer transport protein ExbB
MSLASWTIMVNKALGILHCHRVISRGLPAFWQSADEQAAREALHALDPRGVFAATAAAALAAKRQHEAAAGQGLAGQLPLGEYLADALQHATLMAQARTESGLTSLASVGSTAPFVGLLGTVWGIFHALTALAGESRLVLEKVATPVGEALIMTAAGLFVAIPAVLGYNALVRANRLVLAHLDGFAHALHAWLVAGVGSANGRRE